MYILVEKSKETVHYVSLLGGETEREMKRHEQQVIVISSLLSYEMAVS